MKTSVLSAALAAAFLAAPAYAQPVPDTGTRIVAYADLDLATDAGRRTLDRRIDAAVADACGSAADYDLHGRNRVSACRVETRAAVDRQRAAALALAGRGARIASGR